MSHQRCASMIAEPFEQLEEVRGRRLLAAKRAKCMDLGQEARTCAVERLDGHRAGEVRRDLEPPRANEAERADGRHELRAVDERQPLLRVQHDRLEPDGRQRLAAGQQPSFDPGVSFADERQREVGERCEVAARAHGASTRHDRQHATVEASISSSTSSTRAPELPFASVFARSSIAARTTSGGYGSPTPHAWLRRRRSWSSSVCSAGMDCETNRPKPVLMPYVCSRSPWAARVTTSRAARMRALASSERAAGAPSTAPAQTSSTVSPSPVRTISAVTSRV